ncbi:uncharacterized protein EV420DRAFT_340899 [Desarmillaria tabescens]|uniref:DUF6534 domain-containing protein n=1 Tax=Armillaria tabescens TaxID=1929756 RepID=A0AA39N673_ARMTA|nr:uncharacterized protein EV420DRAFT_340899 [Desarmillaria tabescens]KAK0458943.1 hypothetical protein EV420DRAFT_340899 [Desarmillaria tabescens]
MAPVEIAGVNVPLFTGPLVLGYMWGYGLYGALIVQMYLYFTLFSGDKLSLKIFVWSLFTLETTFVFISTVTAWRTFGLGWGDSNTFFFLGSSFGALPVLSGIISCLTQNFYLWRIWTMGMRKLFIIIGIATVSLAQCLFAIYYGITLALHRGSVNEMVVLSPFRITWLIGCALCDILITATMVLVLHNQKSRAFSSGSSTSMALKRSIKYAVETGIITTFMAITEFILYVAAKHHTFHLTFFLMLSQVYVGSLVATLNTRATNGRGKTDVFTTPPSRFRPGWDRTDSMSQSGESSGRRTGETIVLSDLKYPAPSRSRV